MTNLTLHFGLNVCEAKYYAGNICLFEANIILNLIINKNYVNLS